MKFFILFVGCDTNNQGDRHNQQNHSDRDAGPQDDVADNSVERLANINAPANHSSDDSGNQINEDAPHFYSLNREPKLGMFSTSIEEQKVQVFLLSVPQSSQ